MASNRVEERLPEVLERQRILKEAGLVLAEARRLRDCLDRTNGLLNPDITLSLKAGNHAFFHFTGRVAASELPSWKGRVQGRLKYTWSLACLKAYTSFSSSR